MVAEELLEAQGAWCPEERERPVGVAHGRTAPRPARAPGDGLLTAERRGAASWTADSGAPSVDAGGRHELKRKTARTLEQDAVSLVVVRG